jgi:PKD repeat protein
MILKKYLFSIFTMLLWSFSASAQLTFSPNFPTQTGNITITFNASKGNKALMGYSPTSDVYIHCAVITNLSANGGDWRYNKFTWGTINAAAKATPSGTNLYTFSISNIRTFFGVPASETIQKVVCVFRNGNGTIVAKNDDWTDMYIRVGTTGVLATRLNVPVMKSTWNTIPENMGNPAIGSSLTIGGISSASTNLKLFHNGIQFANTTATSVSASRLLSAGGMQKFKIVANNSTALADSFSFFIPGNTTIAALPAGIRDGINYTSSTSATLVLHAPNKNNVIVLGDFNNWTPSLTFQMNRTSDGQRYWINLIGLTAGTEYAFQYLVDNSLKVADPYSEKVLDPWNDPYINDVAGYTVYPNLKAYPTGKTDGIVGVLQTAKPTYSWQVPNFSRPDQNKLLVYELHLRDFVKEHSWKALKDTLGYLEKLGINAIELMPFNEFDGNDSWGYNPNFFFAPDKYYGPDSDLKLLIDECHKRGIAVIQDIVFNHAWGTCPLAQLYWDGTNNRPAANNPWFNQTAPHPYGFGNDFNFQSTATQNFMQRCLEFWMTEYKVDGFRFDLSKGFTQKYTGGDVGAWSAYDGERVGHVKRLADQIWNVSSSGYVILEHLGDWYEENEYMNYKQGMMPWQRFDNQYSELNMGWSGTGQDISTIYYKHNNNFSRPLRMGNLESHDEERIAFKSKAYGNSGNAAHDVKTLPVYTRRMQASGAFHLLIPGPKMIWQFSELGYDYSINTCGNGTVGTGDACRTDRKPIRWDFLQNVDRKGLYDAWSAIMKLKKAYGQVFAQDLDAGYDLGLSRFKNFSITNAAASFVVIGNFDVYAGTKTIYFPSTGTWTDYMTGNTLTINNNNWGITLNPGEFRIYNNKDISKSNLTPPVTDKTVFFKKPAAWAGAKIHFWNAIPANPSLTTTYPGNSMTQVCGDWYKTTFNGVSTINVLFNDGVVSNQSPDLVLNQDTAYYDGGWLSSKPAIGGNPVASFSASATSGIAPLTVDFNAASSTGCGNLTYSWNFGNGQTANGISAATTFSTAGTYTVSLTVSDNQNRTSSSNQTIMVSAPQQAISVYFKKPTNWAGNVRIYWWNALPSGSLTNGTWPGVLMTADCNGWFKYTFPTAVSSTNLIFTDGTNQTADLTTSTSRFFDGTWLSTTPLYNSPKAIFALSGTFGTIPYSITANASSSTSCNGPLSYAWTFGNGQTGTGSSASATYSSGGTYSVKLVVTDALGLKDSSTQTVTANSTPQVKLHFKRPAAWANAPKLYYWGTTPALASVSWPGFTMTPEITDWYGYTIVGASTANVIFNNNSSPQTADLTNVSGEVWYDNGWVPKPAGFGRMAVSETIDPKPETRFDLFPNPVRDQLTVRLENNEPNRSYQIDLFNASGQKVYSGTVEAGSATHDIQRKNDWKKGLYLYQIWDTLGGTIQQSGKMIFN